MGSRRCAAYFKLNSIELLDTLRYSPYLTQDDEMVVGGPIPIFRILEELFNLQNEVNSTALVAAMAADGFANVLPSDWLCLSCLESFAKARYWIWWYNTKARGRVLGYRSKEDCWFGIDCPIQSKSLVHAVRFNHVCLDTFEDRQAAFSASSLDEDPELYADSGDTSNAQPSTSAVVATVNPNAIWMPILSSFLQRLRDKFFL
ncbi:hypothetical protein BKA62DRAFT_765307 [Auriculariales sp. MPI-PUGE-AT-0066]|nr:hypothetical protein BKA62DRAFT_765307 [Auriculariales sp. MPI-PUGE-AT-0066]